MSTVRAWSYATQKHRRHEWQRIEQKCRKRRRSVSVCGFSRMDGEQWVLALVAAEDDMDGIVAIVRPNGRSLELTEEECEALVNRRSVVVGQGDANVIFDYPDPGAFITRSGHITESWNP